MKRSLGLSLFHGAQATLLSGSMSSQSPGRGDRESIEVRESTRVVLGDIPKRGWCGVLLTLVSCCPRSLRDLPP